MQILDDIVISKYEPSNTDVLWLDVSSEYTQIKAYVDGYWKSIPLTHMLNIYNLYDNLLVTQTINLHKGDMNFISTNLNITLDDLKNAIASLLEYPETCTIKSPSHSLHYSYRGGVGKWHGSIDYDVTDMLIVLIDKDCTITLTGTPINPSEHSVELQKGSNWLGYPYLIPHDLDFIFKFFNPVEGDRVKLGNGTQSIYTNGKWDGPVLMLYPGQGYYYYSVVDDNKTVYFNSLEQVVKDITINGQNMYIQSIGIDNAPTENSSNLITSGAVYAALHQNDTTEP